MQEKRNVVAFDGEIALINVGGKRQRIELLGLQHGTRRIVHGLAVFQIADVGDFRNGLAIGILDDGMIELAADHEIDVLAGK